MTSKALTGGFMHNGIKKLVICGIMHGIGKAIRIQLMDGSVFDNPKIVPADNLSTHEAYLDWFGIENPSNLADPFNIRFIDIKGMDVRY